MNHVKFLIFVPLALLLAGCSLLDEFPPCEVDDSAPRDTTRILAIGNSFSIDAVEHYLYDIAKEDGYVLIIGNMVIGGCSLETHVKNARANSADYSYRKIGADGVRKVTDGVTLEIALADEAWDYVSLQQASRLSGEYDTFKKWLPELCSYVKEHSSSNTKIVLHQTWAYAQDYTSTSFANYNYSQKKMYESLVDAYNKAAKLVGICIIIPTGTAIQNARTSFIGDNMNRDGSHLELTYGRFTAACTWYETFFGNIMDNTYCPDGLGSEYVEVAHQSAFYAVLNPDKVTQIGGE